MTNEKLLNEVLQEKAIENQTIDMMEGMYLKPPSKPNVEYLIELHKKKIAELEASKDDPLIEEMNKRRLREEVIRHMAEQELIDEALDHRTSQCDINRSDARGMV